MPQSGHETYFQYVNGAMRWFSMDNRIPASA